ncbi:hypothetical protein FRC18_008390 [Serendipita sp. 400]|nr:hypothetical protein FRC18_008390 [Serendipita sp. 400]
MYPHHLLSQSFVVLVVLGLIGFVQAGDGCSKANAIRVNALRFRLSVSPSTTDSSTVSSWSKGGGPRGMIPINVANLTNPFSGREYASGSRDNILGTRAYGSGYPYGVSDVTTIKGRPFPHSMWPISWGPGYLGGEEYWGDDIDLIRPGGMLGVVNVSTKDTTKWPNVSSEEVYTMIGDKESLTFMIADLVRICHATPGWPRAFDPVTNSSSSSPSSAQPKPQNVIQYYRSSSFALSYSGYNNTFALPSSNPTTNHDSDPLPGLIVNSAFLSCVNDTIRASLPLMDSLPGKKGLSKGAIAGIVIGSVLGAIIVSFWCWAIYIGKK